MSSLITITMVCVCARALMFGPVADKFGKRVRGRKNEEIDDEKKRYDNTDNTAQRGNTLTQALTVVVVEGEGDMPH